MASKLLTASTQLDNELGFKFRIVSIESENSTLHHHDYYELFLTLADEVKHFVNGVEQILPRGSLIFIRKEDSHYYRSFSSEQVSFVNLAFSEEMLHQLFDYLSSGFCSNKLLSATMPPCVQLYDTSIDWVLNQMQKLNSVSIYDKQKQTYLFKTVIFRIFTRFFSNYYDNETLEDLYIPKWLIELHHNMQKLENFSQPSNHMVEMSRVSRAYLGRMIKKYFNQTISEYINDLRLNYWANLLLNSDIPILEICYNCGFENASWAYTLFKKKYNLTPLQFRKNSIQNFHY